MSKGESIRNFFLIAVTLYLPVAFFAKAEISPGVSVFNLAAFIPMTAALILTYTENRLAGAIGLLKRCFDYPRIRSRIWYLPIFLLYPSIVLSQYLIAVLSGHPAPAPHLSPWMPLVFAVLFIAALSEELGWMGYVYEPMQTRLGALKASLLLGSIWAVFHIPLFTAAGAAPSWIIWQLTYILMTRIIFVWLYNNSGKSLFAVIIAHATFNFGWQFFPPSAGLLVPSFYDPRNLALTTIALAAIVIFLWGPNTLAEFRYDRAKNSA